MHPVPRNSTQPTLSPVQAQVVAALVAGETVSAAAGAAGIHRSTVHEWRKTNPIFNEKFESARREVEFALRDEALELRAIALRKLRAILEDDAVPAAVQLRASLAILKETLRDVPTLPPVDKTEQNPTQSGSFIAADPATPRNAPCPCGSGNKYKRCCGHKAPPVLNVA